jgi:hypothetical protein
LTLPASPNTLCMMQTVEPPINLENWIEKNREKFKPPVSNCYLYDGRDFFVMVIKGPNARNDFHLVDSEEYFYQLKGDIKVRVRECAALAAAPAGHNWGRSRTAPAARRKGTCYFLL